MIFFPVHGITWISSVYLGTESVSWVLSSLSYVRDAPLLPVQEACSLLPKISSKETHPKIAQVLLERHKPDMALLVLKCTGRDSFSATENFEKDGISSLSEAVTVVRVRIECGLLTEAFMYHRSYCSKVKEQRSADVTHSEDAFKSSWIYHVEMMMTEFCTICIERNLVDKMIDLPWDSEEEKHLHKSLFESAHEMPMKPNGSLLVVYYLRVNILILIFFLYLKVKTRLRGTLEITNGTKTLGYPGMMKLSGPFVSFLIYILLECVCVWASSLGRPM
jgi:E3 ubiquitin-protein ligase HOS1